MKTVSRKNVEEEDYQEIFNTEDHHKHEVVVKAKTGRLYWKENKKVSKLIDKKIDLNHLWELFYSLGYDKNSEIIRKLYRNLGVSLSMYWEVFYWEVNNKDAKKYVPNSR